VESEVEGLSVVQEGPYVGILPGGDREGFWLQPEAALAFSQAFNEALVGASMYAGAKVGMEQARAEEPGREAVRHLTPDPDSEVTEE